MFFSFSFPFIRPSYFGKIIEIMTFIHNCEYANPYQIIGFNFIDEIGVLLRALRACAQSGINRKKLVCGCPY